MIRRGNQTYLVGRTPLVLWKRQRRLAKIRIGIGGCLIALAAIGPLVVSRLPAWTAANLIVTTVLFGGLGALHLARGIPRLREVSAERRWLAALESAQLPEARVIS